jgi:hypothetical protein
MRLSDETLFALNEPGKRRHRFNDKVRVKGREDAVMVCEVFEGDPEAIAVLKSNRRSPPPRQDKLSFEFKVVIRPRT